MQNTEETPPILGNWPNVYRLVIGFLIAQVILFYFLTQIFS